MGNGERGGEERDERGGEREQEESWKAKDSQLENFSIKTAELLNK